MVCSLPGSSVHRDSPDKNTGVACTFSSRVSSQPRDQTQVSRIAGRFFTIWATREAHEYWSGKPIPSPGDVPDQGIKPGSPELQSEMYIHKLIDAVRSWDSGSLGCSGVRWVESELKGTQVRRSLGCFFISLFLHLQVHFVLLFYFSVSSSTSSFCEHLSVQLWSVLFCII